MITERIDISVGTDDSCVGSACLLLVVPEGDGASVYIPTYINKAGKIHNLNRKPKAPPQLLGASPNPGGQSASWCGSRTGSRTIQL